MNGLYRKQHLLHYFYPFCHFTQLKDSSSYQSQHSSSPLSWPLGVVWPFYNEHHMHEIPLIINTLAQNSVMMYSADQSLQLCPSHTGLHNGSQEGPCAEFIRGCEGQKLSSATVRNRGQTNLNQSNDIYSTKIRTWKSKQITNVSEKHNENKCNKVFQCFWNKNK